MFGLRTPIALSGKTDEFDSISSILSQSSVARPARVKDAPPWLTSVGDDGGIFHLELPAGADAILVKQTGSADTNSVLSLALGAGCNSEDTGYASDQDSLGTDRNHRKKYKPKSLIGVKPKNSCVNDGGVSDISVITHLKTGHLNNNNNTNIFHNENTSDQFCVNNNFHNKFSDSLSQSVTFTDRDDEIDDGIFLNKSSELRSSNASSFSCASKRSDCSRLTDRSTRSANRHTQLLNRFKKIHEWKTTHVDVVLNNSKCGKFCDSSISCSSASRFGEQVLGIVLGRNEGSSGGHPKARGQQVIVKSVCPDGPASHVQEITPGCWLSSVNDQEMTWDNMKAVLSTLGKVKRQS